MTKEFRGWGASETISPIALPFGTFASIGVTPPKEKGSVIQTRNPLVSVPSKYSNLSALSTALTTTRAPVSLAISLSEKVTCFSFNTGVTMKILGDGTAIVDRRSMPPGAMLGPPILAFQRCAVTVSCTATGSVTITTSLWRDIELGVCETHSFVEIAQVLLGIRLFEQDDDRTHLFEQ